MSDETADALAMLAYDVWKWGGGDSRAFLSLVASGIDLAPPTARAGYWRLWLNRAAQNQTVTNGDKRCQPGEQALKTLKTQQVAA